jgi:allantoinase
VSVDLLIRGGLVVLEDGARRVDVAVHQGKIVSVGESGVTASETVDAAGLVVLPGVVDNHVHFNDPGRAHWEGWEAGTRGAAAGGVTTVLEMPLNASPPTTTPAAFDAKLQAARKSAVVDFGLWGGLVPDNLDQVEELHRRGVVAFKAFMCDSGIQDFPHVPDGLVRAALKLAARFGGVIAVHAERHDLVTGLGGTLRDAGRTDRPAWVEARPPEAEAAAISGLVGCVRGAGAGARGHVVHVSAAAGLNLIRQARSRGLDITAETCPHYLFFTDADFARVGPALKCAPPIRDAANRDALWDGVLRGDVDVIGSDHSPCPAADKAKGVDDIWRAWGGIAGIQFTLPVLFTAGVHQRGMPLEQVARLTATNPANLFKLSDRKGSIRVGLDADFALVDPTREWTATKDQLETTGKVSGYLGAKFKGAVVRTIVRGKTVYVDGKVVGRPGEGQLIVPKHR